MKAGGLAHAIDDVLADRGLTAFIKQGFERTAQWCIWVEVQKSDAVRVGQ